MQVDTRSQAITNLYASNFQRVRSACMAELHNWESAQDLAQDIFVRVCRCKGTPSVRLLDRALKCALIDKSKRDGVRDKWTPSDFPAKSAYQQAAFGEELTASAVES
jgi:DNA-directed RNA polymerase specialized sigma24 family protein